MNVELTLLLIGAYLLGAVPFGVLVARAHGVDIMSIGSGNIGATNVLRVLDKKAGFLVFFLDVLKGFLPALGGHLLFPGRQDLAMLAGFTAVLGHTFSPFLKFKGGKGISTALGMSIGATPIVAAISFGLFIVILATVRYMSLASMIAVLATIPAALALHASPWVVGGYCLLTVFVVFKHRSNIGRLRSGTEPRFALKKTIAVAPEPLGDDLAT